MTTSGYTFIGLSCPIGLELLEKMSHKSIVLSQVILYNRGMVREDINNTPRISPNPINQSHGSVSR